jgi:hypothetical protein
MFRLAVITAALMTLVVAPAAGARPLPVDGLTVHRESCPDYEDGGSCARPETAEIWIAPDADRFDFWHEIGHVWDERVLDDRTRAWFAHKFRRLGVQPGDPWLGDHAFYARGGGAPLAGELFADAFALCWTNWKPRRRAGLVVSGWPIAYGYTPGMRLHRRICNAIAVLELVRN